VISTCSTCIFWIEIYNNSFELVGKASNSTFHDKVPTTKVNTIERKRRRHQIVTLLNKEEGSNRRSSLLCFDAEEISNKMTIFLVS